MKQLNSLFNLKLLQQLKFEEIKLDISVATSTSSLDHIFFVNHLSIKIKQLFFH